MAEALTDLRSSQMRGVAFMVATTFIFAVQDGLTRHLAELHHPIFIVMVRYWAFAAFVVILSANRPGGLRAATRTLHPAVQLLRGLMLAGQICVVTYTFTRLGLAETHSLLAIYPLLIAAGGAIFLGERVLLNQWIAIALGFSGVVILLEPGSQVFDPFSLVPLCCAFVFAAYGLLTRWVGRTDSSSTSFFFTGIGGAIGMTLVGPFFWSSFSGTDWLIMAGLCVTGALGHFLLIKAYEFAEAATLQPFAYLQLGLASLIGVTIFGEQLDLTFMIGSAFIVGAGIYAIVAGRSRSRRTA